LAVPWLERKHRGCALFISGRREGILQMNQSVSVKSLTFRCHFERSEKSSSFLTASHLPKKKRCASADSVFSFRHSAYTPGKGVKDWLIISFCWV
jgi:hypothetical protein